MRNLPNGVVQGSPFSLSFELLFLTRNDFGMLSAHRKQKSAFSTAGENQLKIDQP